MFLCVTFVIFRDGIRAASSAMSATKASTRATATKDPTRKSTAKLVTARSSDQRATATAREAALSKATTTSMGN